jgi:hypothetical protein
MPGLLEAMDTQAKHSQARDLERHAELRKCPQCGALYEVHPEDLAVPSPLTTDEARARFPGVMQPQKRPGDLDRQMSYGAGS